MFALTSLRSILVTICIYCARDNNTFTRKWTSAAWWTCVIEPIPQKNGCSRWTRFFARFLKFDRFANLFNQNTRSRVSYLACTDTHLFLIVRVHTLTCFLSRVYRHSRISYLASTHAHVSPILRAHLRETITISPLPIRSEKKAWVLWKREWTSTIVWILGFSGP